MSDQSESPFEPDVQQAVNDLEILVEGVDKIPEDAPDEDVEFKGKSKAELAQIVRAQRAEVLSAKERSVEQVALKEALDELKESRTRPIPMMQSQQAPTETEDQFRERVNKSFYDDPYGTLTEFQVKKLAPEVQRIMSSNMRLSRKLTALDPKRSDTFTQYSAEIDDFVARLPAQEKLYDPDVYERAHDAIISRHVTEIVERKVAEATKAKAPAPTTNVPFTEAGRNTAPLGTTRQRIVLSAKEVDYINKHGLTKESYAEYLVRHPERRLK